MPLRRLFGQGREPSPRPRPYDYRADPDMAPFLGPEVLALSERLARRGALERETYEHLYRERFETGRELVIGQTEYGPQHKERFWELFNACAILLEGRAAPCLLEVGTSELTALYRPLLPGLALHLADRPAEPGYIGFTREVSEHISGCSAYFAVDLEGGAPAVAASGLEAGAYDLVVFTEVIEHLDVNPVEMLGALLGLLKDDGFLYLTTPNFFRRENLEKIARLENPQEVFPAGDGNWDGHHHHREYAAKELLRFAVEAGGRVAAFYFSDCWDRDPSLPEHERANLVLVVARGAGG